MADDDQYEEKRKDLVKFIQEAKGSEDVVTLVGIDHGFSFLKFGTVIAANLRRTRPKPSDHWHLDESAPRRREGGAMI